MNKRPPHVLERFRRERPGNIAISSVTASELTFSVIKSGPERNRQARTVFFDLFDLFPLDASVIWHYCEISNNLERRGTPIGSLGAMIAAHAKVLSAVLVLNNVREFSGVDGLFLFLAPTLRSPMNQAWVMLLMSF
nr:type II toxin-antitoxin system VapC family toxin [Chlorobaculum sp. 24CR]